MPIVPTAQDHVIEAVVNGPDGANRLYTCTGVATGNASANNQQKTEMWTFFVGPTLDRRQLIRAIGTASIDAQGTYLYNAPISYVQTEIVSVEADWDDENNRVEVRVELGVNANGMNVSVTVQRVRYWVTILAEV